MVSGTFEINTSPKLQSHCSEIVDWYARIIRDFITFF